MKSIMRLFIFIFVAFVGPAVADYPRHPCHDVPDNPNRWCDGFDGLDVGQFSIMIGNGSGLLQKEKPSIERVSTIEVRTQRGNFSGRLNCYTQQGELTEHLWTTFTNPLLPWSLDIHSGHACSFIIAMGAWDNMWINYSNQHVNVPDDPRCWWIDYYRWRCVLLERPEEAAAAPRVVTRFKRAGLGRLARG
ncbi:hypothetical protein PpBr36_00877 [Pyricularia pennisetigena]|uniref:hypothetical protein n=1 Tax=Pyricularia pennisetigena TaxID=1578925 RepID=UPI00115402D0|nr:hypothetical protein PpBr36_00877 [Pyricularia pennisetigena]TLS29611.1 hypothetical protein PpBr36_00877 [Pyricularia pennisetigena]